jgi:hypothetical protein
MQDAVMVFVWGIADVPETDFGNMSAGFGNETDFVTKFGVLGAVMRFFGG